MTTESFQGNIPVSTAKRVFKGMKLGRDDFIKQAVVDKGLPIQETGFPVRDNSEILFGGFPEEAAVKGLIHDAAIELYSREPDFRALGVEPSAEEIHNLLEGVVEGSRNSNPRLGNRVNELETRYGVSPGQILDYSFTYGSMDGLTVSDVLEDLAEYREDVWLQDTRSFRSVTPEVSVFADGLSGRMDLLYSGGEDADDQIREIKMTDEPSRYDEFQVAAYWLMKDEQDADAVVEYPVIDERLEFEPEEENNDFDPREYAFDVYRSRDRARQVIDELRDLQETYFDLHDSREKATREALRDLEVR